MSPEQQAEKYATENNYGGVFDTIRAAFLSGVQWHKENGWISVKTELPEFGEKVLVAIDTDYVLLMGQLMTNGWAAFYLDGLKLTFPSIVTHWQPLPLSPKNDNVSQKSLINKDEEPPYMWEGYL